MTMRRAGEFVNRLLFKFGCQAVSTGAARHMSMLKDIQQCGATVDLRDLAIRCELNRLAGKPFNLVQVGANDGVRYDPYRKYIQEYRMSGVLVEPMPIAYDQLVANYLEHPQLRFENAAIGFESGESTLYTLCDRDDPGADYSVFSSFNISAVQRSRKWLKRDDLWIKPVSVSVITFMELLAKHAINHVSMVAIDTEGHDYEILKMIDFDKVKPSIIEFEHSHLCVADEIACNRLLAQKGYALWRFFGDDTLALLRNQK